MIMDKLAAVLRIYISETDRVGTATLYEEIVREAREKGLAGATVFRGILSFGASHSLNYMKIFALSNHLPIIVEMVDHEDKLRKFADEIQKMIHEGGKGVLMTIQPVEVLEYKAGDKVD